MEPRYEFLEVRVKRGLTSQRYGDMPGRKSLVAFRSIHEFRTSITGYEAVLFNEAVSHYFFRWVPWIWYLYRDLDSPPAVETAVVTHKRRRHLDAAVGGHAVELRFIAVAVVAHAFIEPQAGLYSAMRASKVVAVFFKECFCGLRA